MTTLSTRSVICLGPRFSRTCRLRLRLWRWRGFVVTHDVADAVVAVQAPAQLTLDLFAPGLPDDHQETAAAAEDQGRRARELVDRKVL